MKKYYYPLAILLLVFLISATVPSVIFAEITGMFKGVSFMSEIGESGKRIYSVSGGTGVLKNEKGEVIAEGKLSDKEGFISMQVKKGSTFAYVPEKTKVTHPKWGDKKPTEFAHLAFADKDQWTVKDENFHLLMEVQALFVPSMSLLLPESIVRASIIELPAGDFELFGYKVKSSKEGATVKFLHGVVIETKGCEAIELKAK